jgi:hypothetical protein
MKFCFDQKVEFKKSFELYRKILATVLMKVASFYMAWTKLSEMLGIFNVIG